MVVLLMREGVAMRKRARQSVNQIYWRLITVSTIFIRIIGAFYVGYYIGRDIGAAIFG